MRARAWAIIGGARPGDAPSGTSKSGLKRRRGKKMPFSAIAARPKKVGRTSSLTSWASSEFPIREKLAQRPPRAGPGRNSTWTR